MSKFSAGATMVMTWTPTGSTVVTTIAAQGRDVEHGSSMDDADATGYGDSNHVYVTTIGDEEVGFELLLDDATLTVEDLFTKGAKGTFIYAPAGTAAGKRKVTFPGFVSTADDSYPYTDVAIRSIQLKPTGAVLRSVYP